jgi:hypothetical protein
MKLNYLETANSRWNQAKKEILINFCLERFYYFSLNFAEIMIKLIKSSIKQLKPIQNCFKT